MDKPKRILVVDDEELNRELLKGMLTPLGNDVIQANNGEEALEKVRKIPIVMVTALKDVKDRVKALEVGADDFLIGIFITRVGANSQEAGAISQS